MLTPAQRSGAYFESGLYCAESVLQAIADECGILSAQIPRIATGFCGGMALTGGLCGALTGGIMALGLLYGRNSGTESRDAVYDRTRRLIEAFEHRFGSTRCTGLLGCDLSTPEGLATFERKGLEQSLCLKLTTETAGLVDRIIRCDNAARGTSHIDDGRSILPGGGPVDIDDLAV